MTKPYLLTDPQGKVMHRFPSLASAIEQRRKYSRRIRHTIKIVKTA